MINKLFAEKHGDTRQNELHNLRKTINKQYPSSQKERNYQSPITSQRSRMMCSLRVLAAHSCHPSGEQSMEIKHPGNKTITARSYLRALISVTWPMRDISPFCRFYAKAVVAGALRYVPTHTSVHTQRRDALCHLNALLRLELVWFPMERKVDMA